MFMWFDLSGCADWLLRWWWWWWGCVLFCVYPPQPLSVCGGCYLNTSLYMRVFDVYIMLLYNSVPCVCPVCLLYGDFVAHTNPYSCLSHAEACPVQLLAPCGGDLVWVSGSWQKTQGWPGQRTCHRSLRCALSCYWMMLRTLMTHCSHSAICSER